MWSAPYFEAPPSLAVRGVEQRCALKEGHDGDHRSVTNVIHPNDGSVSPVWPTYDRRQVK